MLPTVHTDNENVYAPSNFSTFLDPPDWRIYWVGADKSNGWLIRFVGSDAEIKAKAISMILNAKDM
jgi:hypothetical protein